MQHKFPHHLATENPIFFSHHPLIKSHSLSLPTLSLSPCPVPSFSVFSFAGDSPISITSPFRPSQSPSLTHRLRTPSLIPLLFRSEIESDFSFSSLSIDTRRWESSSVVPTRAQPLTAALDSPPPFCLATLARSGDLALPHSACTHHIKHSSAGSLTLLLPLLNSGNIIPCI
jgi:hypothetical protein